MSRSVWHGLSGTQRAIGFRMAQGKRKDTGTDFTKGGADKSAFRRSRSGWKTLRCWFNIF